MNRNYICQNASDALPHLLRDLLDEGDEVSSRAGRTMELTHVGITLEKPWQRELLVPHRKPNLAAQIAETMWVLAGRDDMEFLSRYLPRATDFSDDGKSWRAGYGDRIRHAGRRTGAGNVDQLKYVVDQLKLSPLTRQAVISIWDPVVDTMPGKDIPCNDWITFSNRLGELDMHVGIRSNDAIWGWSGINAFEWSAMLEIVAGLVGVGVGKLHFSTTSFHVYEAHWERAGKMKRCEVTMPTEDLKDSPRFGVQLSRVSLEKFDEWTKNWFAIEAMIREDSKYADEAVEAFPEPMLQSWLRVLQWWWSGDARYMEPLLGTRLGDAWRYSVQPSRTGGETKPETMSTGRLIAMLQTLSLRSDFIATACKLHLEKHAAYGDSWKRRGEMLAILPNIARKVDRLGGAETSDETSADTAMDLMVYLAKYRTWLTDCGMGDGPSRPDFLYSEDPHWANELLLKTDDELGKTFVGDVDTAAVEQVLRDKFEELTGLATMQVERYKIVDQMLEDAYLLARTLWERAQGVDEYLGADHD